LQGKGGGGRGGGGKEWGRLGKTPVGGTGTREINRPNGEETGWEKPFRGGEPSVRREDKQKRPLDRREITKGAFRRKGELAKGLRGGPDHRRGGGNVPMGTN